MFGKEYNIINSCFTAGYIIAQIPHAIALQRVKPRYWCVLPHDIPTTLFRACANHQVPRHDADMVSFDNGNSWGQELQTNLCDQIFPGNSGSLDLFGHQLAIRIVCSILFFRVKAVGLNIQLVYQERNRKKNRYIRRLWYGWDNVFR